MSDDASPKAVRSKAWLLRGLLSSAPGVLEFARGRLSFTLVSSGTLWVPQLRKLEQIAGKQALADRLERGQSAEVFAIAVQQLRYVVFPWYYFDGGIVIGIDSAKYRFSFLQPQNTKWPEPRPDDIVGAVTTIIEGGSEIVHGRAIGKLWKAALVGHPLTR